jgi:putative membrane-bound dehydrogenase-like protein
MKPILLLCSAALTLLWHCAVSFAAEPHKLLTPTESWQSMEVPSDLQLDLVLHEPLVAQPVFMNFDERGRLWVVQYLQYPQPAGVKVLSHDKFWRAVYDQVPPAPPHHVRGKDKITIHEDTNGDGTFDKHSTFLDGLNMCTAVCTGRGGAWVLHPPYLLFYPDRDQNDAPDGDPEVHLAGFGLEDTHSVVNSLCWGPDGWLYAAQGSTVTGDVKRPGLDKTAMHSLGQLIWRYHPQQKRYENFAEGGGNAFCCEIDSQGRIFSGHNGGDTRGFHYMQGAYLQKGFQKHGPLSNPYAFGYFPAMQHDATPRFTHAFTFYEAAEFPAKYRGQLFGVAPLLNHVVHSERLPQGSTFATRDVGLAVKSSDRCFRPTDIKLGPDGALYIADWYDAEIAHLRNAGVPYDNSTGRIYRLRAKNATPTRMPNIAQATSSQLVEWLQHENRTVRQLALKQLYDRRDMALLPELRAALHANEVGQNSLETLWAIHACGGWDEATIMLGLGHSDPFVRLWTVRLTCDQLEVAPTIVARIAGLAKTEENIEVRSQLASSAKRLSAVSSMALVRNLLTRHSDAADARLPLQIWWAMEAHCEHDREVVLNAFTSPEIWQSPLVSQTIATRLMRRFAAAGQQQDLATCARLFALAPNKSATKQLMRGFEEGMGGRTIPHLPETLKAALAAAGGGSLSLRVRLGQAAALAEAISAASDAKHAVVERGELLLLLSEVKHEPCVPMALEIVFNAKEKFELRRSALEALQAFEQIQIAKTLIAQYADLPPELREPTQSLLTSRTAWLQEFMSAVDQGTIQPSDVSREVVLKIVLRPDPHMAAAVKKHWGQVEGATSEQMRAEVTRLVQVIRSGQGDPYQGERLYHASCGKCHKLFGKGGDIGPDLTADKRDDLERMLLNVVNPSAEIREGYEPMLVATEAGRILTGFIVEQDNERMWLRNVEGQTTVIAREEIEEQRRLTRSIMPEGLLNQLSEQQVRDLFAFLRMTQPLVK